jgi:hypothetical protein
VIALLLSIPGHAEAEGASPGSHSSRSAEFAIDGTDGFRLNVKSERGKVTIVVADRRPPVATFSRSGDLLAANSGNVASSTYVAFGASRDPREIDVPLGRLGRVSVSFRPSGKVRTTNLGPSAAGGCTGPRRLVRKLGIFSGTIEFRGEHGYTTVAASHAKGSLGTPLAGACLESGEEDAVARPFSLEGSAALTALDNRAGVQFEAVTTGGQVDYTASSVGLLGASMVVLRSAQAVAPKRSFAFDDLLRSARIAPPRPFSGEAGYELRQGPIWTGDLSVDFPGASTSLTGPDYRATLGY